MTTMTPSTETASSPAIWNPNAAANWCLLFTPAFGAYLHAQNWRALGESERAAGSMKWFYVAIGLLIVYVLMGVALPSEKAADGLSRLIGMVFLLSWYFRSARPQAKYVKEKFGPAYVRQPWSKALGYALAGLIGYVVFAFVIGVIAAIVK